MKCVFPPREAVRIERYRAAVRATWALTRQGHIVFSPIVHSHPLAEHGLPGDWPFWERIDRAFLERADELLVLQLDGWRESVGVGREIAIATELGKPVGFIEAWALEWRTALI